MSKKIIFLALFCCIFAFFTNLNIEVRECFAEDLESGEEPLEDEIERQLETLNLDDMDYFFESLSQDEIDKFDLSNFKNLVEDIIAGEKNFNLSTIFDELVIKIKDNFSKLVSTIIYISLLSFIYNIFCKTSYRIGSNKIVFLLIYASISLIVISLCKDCVDITKNFLQFLTKQINVVAPILLTLMLGLGATVTVGVYQQLVSFLCVLVSNVLSGLLLQIIIIFIAFACIGKINEDVKLTKMTELFKSLFKWILGICTSFFLGFLGVRSLVSGQTDGISIKTAKYAIKNYIPYVGSFISQGISYVEASSVIIKNAVGTGVLILVFFNILSPLLYLISVSLALKIAGAITEPLSDGKISSFLGDIATGINMLIACLACASLMFFLCIFLIMSTANGVF